MAQVPYTNDSTTTVHLDGKRILPGQTRLVDETLIPRPGTAPAEEAEADPGGGSVLDLLDGTVEEINAAIPDLTLDQLHQLRDAEEDGKTRSTLMKAFDQAILDRAEGGQGGEEPSS